MAKLRSFPMVAGPWSYPSLSTFGSCSTRGLQPLAELSTAEVLSLEPRVWVGFMGDWSIRILVEEPRSSNAG